MVQEVKKIKKGKAVGPDDIPGEVILRKESIWVIFRKHMIEFFKRFCTGFSIGHKFPVKSKDCEIHVWVSNN